MVEFTQVLCPTDLSELSIRPLTFAAALAKWYEANLTVLHVAPGFDPIPVAPAQFEGTMQVVYPPTREELLEEVQRIVKAAGADQVGAKIVAEAGDPARTIVNHALAIRADLIVMGTHGRSGFERFILGSVAEKVLQRAPCPVLTVPPHMKATKPAEVLFKRILCPIDFSPSSLQALGFALDLARQADGVVTLVHAIEWMAEEQPPTQTHFNVPEYRQHMIAAAKERLEALTKDEEQTWSEIRHMVVLGRAHRAILQHIEQEPQDLIVMGAQGRGGLGLALFGSTTHQVVRGADCPVLVVRALKVAPTS